MQFRNCKESNRYSVKFFNKKYAVVSKDHLHIRIDITGHVKKIKILILHYKYMDAYQCISKFNNDSTFGAVTAINKRE